MLQMWQLPFGQPMCIILELNLYYLSSKLSIYNRQLEQMASKIENVKQILKHVLFFVIRFKYHYNLLADKNYHYFYDQNKPSVCNSFGTRNNILQVFPIKEIYSPAPSHYLMCNGDTIKVRINTNLLTFQDNDQIYVYGSWNNWKEMIKMNKGYDQMMKKHEYYVILNLEGNKTYQYKFFVNGKFIHDNHLPAISDGFGGFNNRIHVLFNIYDQINSKTSLNSFLQNQQIQCQWQQLKLGENNFKRLFGHSMNLINSKLYVFGGFSKGTFSNCFIQYDLKNFELDLIDYYLISQRAFHNSATYGNKIIIYGGINKDYLRDYYVFNTSDKSWTELKQGEIQGNYPHKRQRNSCVLYNTNLIFFGGYFCSYDQQVQSYYNDLYLLDILQVPALYKMQWKTIDIKGKKPKPRYGHSANVIQNKMYIFGGIHKNQQKNITSQNLNDVWLIDFNQLIWIEFKVKGAAPTPRHGHTSTLVGNNLFIFGGKGDNNVIFNDLFILLTISREWQFNINRMKAKIKGGLPPIGRVNHAAQYYPDQNSIIIFGGYTKYTTKHIYFLRLKN